MFKWFSLICVLTGALTFVNIAITFMLFLDKNQNVPFIFIIPVNVLAYIFIISQLIEIFNFACYLDERNNHGQHLW